jgi:hypothetical protein
MSNYNKVLENVEWLLEKYNNVIDNEKKLVLLYWKHIDKLNVTKDSIPTQEFLSNRTTSPQVIADAYWLIKIREGMSE